LVSKASRMAESAVMQTLMIFLLIIGLYAACRVVLDLMRDDIWKDE